MSLRDRNSLVPTGKPAEQSSGSLRTAARATTVSRPNGASQSAIMQATAALAISAIKPVGKLGFIIDATGSRSHTWKEAQSIQARMFQGAASFGHLSMRLVHYGGGNISVHNWSSKSEDVVQQMAKVECKSGSTQITPGLEAFLADHERQKANSIIIVSDSFEESWSELREIAEQLLAARIKVFTFLDGDNPVAEEAFRQLSEITGGSFAKFGADMPLSELCEGVARMTVGGAAALQGLANAAVKNLLLAGPKP